jgi:hypothetical protein
LVSSAKITSKKCVVCSGGTHQLVDCSKIKTWLVDERYNAVYTRNLYIVNLGEDYISFKCPSSYSICKKMPSYVKLHRDPNANAENATSQLLC